MSQTDEKDLATRYKIDSYIIKRFIAVWGKERTTAILDACQVPPPTCIRVNHLQISTKVLEERLTAKGYILHSMPEYDCAFTVSGVKEPLSHTPEYLNGDFFIQSKASVFPPLILNPQPNSHVIDLAAAPGGKTTHLAEIMKNTGAIIAVEPNRQRIGSLVYNLRRLSIQNTLVTRMDARRLQRTAWKFDYILLDAPCSGEGLLALDPKRGRNRGYQDIRECSLLQSQLLDVAIYLLKPGGTLVYSTCSFAPEENEHQIDLLLRRYPQLVIESINPKIGEPGLTSAFDHVYNPQLKLTRRLFPDKDKTIGFYIAKLSLPIKNH